MATMDDTLSGILDYLVFPISENIHEKGTGNNGKHILICLSGADTPDNQIFLEKVMAAAEIDLAADAFIVRLEEGEQFSFSSLDHAMGFSIALFFGIRPSDAGLNVNAQKYTSVTIAGKTFLFSDTLDVIQAKQDLKRPLWEALKSVFGN